MPKFDHYCSRIAPFARLNELLGQLWGLGFPKNIKALLRLDRQRIEETIDAKLDRQWLDEFENALSALNLRLGMSQEELDRRLPIRL